MQPREERLVADVGPERVLVADAHAHAEPDAALPVGADDLREPGLVELGRAAVVRVEVHRRRDAGLELAHAAEQDIGKGIGAQPAAQADGPDLAGLVGNTEPERGDAAAVGVCVDEAGHEQMRAVADRRRVGIAPSKDGVAIGGGDAAILDMDGAVLDDGGGRAPPRDEKASANDLTHGRVSSFLADARGPVTRSARAERALRRAGW